MYVTDARNGVPLVGGRSSGKQVRIQKWPAPFVGWAVKCVALDTEMACPDRGRPFLHVESGGVLLSHPLPEAVPSALEGLASGFGMRPGVSPPL